MTDGEIMKDIDEIAFIISARVNSTRVHKKMTRPFGDSCLFEIALKKFLSVPSIPKQNIFAAVGEDELTAIATKLGVNIFKRSDKSVNSAVMDLRDAWEWCYELSNRYKYYCVLNSCQPYIQEKTIDSFVQTAIHSENRSLISAIEMQDYYWNDDKAMDISKFMTKEMPFFAFNTRFAPVTYRASHTLQLGVIDDLVNGLWLGTFKANDPELFLVSEEESFDIDHQWQFDMAELRYQKQTRAGLKAE